MGGGERGEEEEEGDELPSPRPVNMHPSSAETEHVSFFNNGGRER